MSCFCWDTLYIRIQMYINYLVLLFAREPRTRVDVFDVSKAYLFLFSDLRSHFIVFRVIYSARGIPAPCPGSIRIFLDFTLIFRLRSFLRERASPRVEEMSKLLLSYLLPERNYDYNSLDTLNRWNEIHQQTVPHYLIISRLDVFRDITL